MQVGDRVYRIHRVSLPWEEAESAGESLQIYVSSLLKLAEVEEAFQLAASRYLTKYAMSTEGEVVWEKEGALLAALIDSAKWAKSRADATERRKAQWEVHHATEAYFLASKFWSREKC